MDNLETLINNNQIDYYFLVVDHFLDINISSRLANFYLIYAFDNPHLNNHDSNLTPYYCLQKQGIKLSQKNSGELIAHPLVLDFIKSTSAKTGHWVAIVPFKPSSKIEFVCAENNWLYIANSSRINRLLEDKIKFYRLASDASLPLIPSSVDTLTKENFLKYQKLYCPKLVVQSHFGWAGNSTYTFSDWHEVSPSLINSTVKFSPYLTGYSLINNCVQTSTGLIQSPPGLQYTGLEGFTANPFTTVGRQWPSNAPHSVIKEIYQITQDFSQKILVPNNYKGFFGLDFFVDDHQRVFLLECNPRLTASFAFYTQIELNNHINPLFYFHLLEFSRTSYQHDLSKEQSRFDNPTLIGSEIIKKNSDNQTISKYNDFIAFSTTVSPITFTPNIRQTIDMNLT